MSGAEFSEFIELFEKLTQFDKLTENFYRCRIVVQLVELCMIFTQFFSSVVFVQFAQFDLCNLYIVLLWYNVIMIM